MIKSIQLGISLIIIAYILSGCKTKTVFVPVESVKTEYKDRLQRDSVYMLDSVIIRITADTVFSEKYKFLYRDKLVRDTICKTDSVAVPYPVVEPVEVNHLHTWQLVLMCLGGVLIGLGGFRLLRLFKLF